MISLVLLAGLFSQIALADSYTSTTMRLLHYEGTVEIEDASGKPRAVMGNVRFSSGESMKTAAASSASVGLDEGRIVTLNEKSRVELKKQDGAVSMNLTEGIIFLDVSEKLEANETMDITTATMAIGIRGTIVYVSSEPVTDATSAGMESVDLEGLAPEKGHIVSISQIVVTDETSFAITPVYDFVLGDSGNYKIDTVDATGEFDVPPIYPIDGFGMGNPADFSSVADSSLDDGEETSVEAAATESATIEAAPAPVGSDPDVIDAAPAEPAPAELSREEDQADEDALEETTEDEIEQARLPEEEPQEEPSEEEPPCLLLEF